MSTRYHHIRFCSHVKAAHIRVYFSCLSEAANPFLKFKLKAGINFGLDLFAFTEI